MTANLKQRFAAALWRMADLDQASTPRRSFRARAYRRAVWALDDLGSDLSEQEDGLLAVPGIGSGIASLIQEFRATGDIARLRSLSYALAGEALGLSRLPRMTREWLIALKNDLEGDSSADLLRAISEGKVKSLVGLGRHTADLWGSILEREIDHRGLPAFQAHAFAERLAAHIEPHFPSTAVHLVGSVRRLEEWVEVLEMVIVEGESVTSFLERSALVRSSSTSAHIPETPNPCGRCGGPFG